MAKKTISSKSASSSSGAAAPKAAAVPDYSQWDDEELEAALAKACKADKPEKLLAILAGLEAKPGSEITHSKTALEYAMEADADECFKALLNFDGAPNKVLATRLWGGQKPIHHCALTPNPATGMPRGAPRCLAMVLALDPGSFALADEEDRTAMDWAAMSPKGDTFGPLFDAAMKAKADGCLSHEKLSSLAANAAFHAVAYGGDEAACMAVLEKIGEAGLDWRSLRSPHGQSLLGKCLSEEAAYSKIPGIGAKLLAEGADPRSPFVREPRPYEKKPKASPPVPCIDYALNPDSPCMASIGAPKLFIAFLKCLDDEAFATAIETNEGTTLDPKDFYERLARRAGPELVAEVRARRDAVRESAALRSSGLEPKIARGASGRPL